MIPDPPYKGIRDLLPLDGYVNVGTRMIGPLRPGTIQYHGFYPLVRVEYPVELLEDSRPQADVQRIRLRFHGQDLRISP